MKKRKIRGHNKLHKLIEDWRVENTSIELNEYLLNESDRYYAKIRVHPWSGISLINSVIPEPKGKSKYLILNGLIDIYETWKTELDNIGQPYYLKIWLFEPRFSLSQVVCAIGDRIEFYNDAFYETKENKKFQSENYGKLREQLESFNWKSVLDEDHFEDNEIRESNSYTSQEDYEETKKWFNNLLKKPHRTTKADTKEEYYSFKKGTVWIGEKKKNAL